MPTLMFMYLCLAAYAARQAWLYGSLFARRRALLQTKPGWLSELLLCRLCLSYHVPYLTALALASPSMALSTLGREEAATWAIVPLQLLAVTGVLLLADRLTDTAKDRQTNEEDHE